MKINNALRKKESKTIVLAVINLREEYIFAKL